MKRKQRGGAGAGMRRVLYGCCCAEASTAGDFTFVSSLQIAVAVRRGEAMRAISPNQERSVKAVHTPTSRSEMSKLTCAGEMRAG